MEIRKLSIWMAFSVVAAISQNTEARHSIERRETEVEPYDFQADDANETEQNTTQSTVEDTIPDVEILTLPTSYNITIGQSVRLECRTDSDAVVDWTKDDKHLVLNSHVFDTDKYKFNESATTNFDLIVKAAEPSDSGVYRCKVQQAKLSFVDHTLLISEKPKIVSISASDLGRPLEGSDLVLTCNTTGVPEPQIIWSVQQTIIDQHSGEPSTLNRKLTENDGVFGHHTVTIRNVKKEQSGTYYCYVFSSAGSDTKAVIVSVLGKPRVHVPKTVVNSAINIEAFLQCSVHEESPVQITWYLNNLPITSNDRVRITTQGAHSNLTVVPASDADFGSYSCRADNDYGYHSRSVQLVELPVVESLDADGPKLTFRVHSHQELEEIEVQLRELTTGQWKSKQVTLPEERHHEYEITYTVKDLEPNKYEAVVKVKNTKGWSEPATTIISIAERPQLIQGASVYRGNDAATNRPATVLLSTVLMYLLVRML